MYWFCIRLFRCVPKRSEIPDPLIMEILRLKEENEILKNRLTAMGIENIEKI